MRRPLIPLDAIFKTKLHAAIEQGLRDWHSAAVQHDALAELRIVQQRAQQDHGNLRQAGNAVLLEALARLQSVDARGEAILRLHYLDGLTVYQIGAQLSLGESAVNKLQRQAKARLADILYAMEQTVYVQQRSQLDQRLEAPTYDQLFGLSAAREQLAAQINKAGAPWLVTLAGMGGIGKTALADSLLRSLLGDARWHEIAWVTARPHLFHVGGSMKSVTEPALTTAALCDALCTQLLPDSGHHYLTADAQRALLQARFTTAPHLVVIDNLESVLDLESLLATVRTWLNPSKFLFTTRHSLYREPDIYHFAIPELSEGDAMALVRHEAEIRNLPDLATASAADLQGIYATVGGNPLALRLVVGQLHLHTLPQVLADLRLARGQPVANLYTHIYRRAWENLSESARRTLLLMPLTPPNGSDWAFLLAMGHENFTEDELRQAFHTLIELNLVDSRGNLHERRYSIHSLTRTFLHEQVLQWQ